jgi:hypothetical protein
MENDNKNEKKSKLSLSPEQIDKGAEALGKFAEKTDNFYDNVKGKLGSSGKVIGFAVLATLIFALIHTPGLVWVFGIMIALGSAPTLRKKYLEIKATGAEHMAKKKAEADSKKSLESK